MSSNLDIRAVLDMFWLLPLLSIYDFYWKFQLIDFFHEIYFHDTPLIFAKFNLREKYLKNKTGRQKVDKSDICDL